jgi:hypothetical protein
MRYRSTIFLSFFLFGFFAAKSQDKVYMPFFQIENMHWGYQMSAAKIFRTFLNNDNKYTLLLPETKDTIYPNETFQQTKDNANAVGAKYFIVGEMNALNDVMIISMTLYNSADGSKVWSDVLKARTPDDLDPILQRFANNIGTDQKASKDGDIYSVTNYDSKPLTKVDASVNYGVAISGAYYFIDNVDNTASAGFGALVSYDIRDVILDLQGELLFGDVRFQDIKISCLYPFTSSKNTPFLGGSIAYSGTTVTYNSGTSNFIENSGSGLAIQANGGMIFSRSSNVNFRISGAFTIPFYQVGDHTPLGAMISASILF